MSSNFFASRHQPKTNTKVTTKNAPGSRTNVKKNTGIKKSGRGR